MNRQKPKKGARVNHAEDRRLMALGLTNNLHLIASPCLWPCEPTELKTHLTPTTLLDSSTSSEGARAGWHKAPLCFLRITLTA